MKLQESFIEYGVVEVGREPVRVPRGSWTSDFDEAIRMSARYAYSIPEKEWAVVQRETEIHSTDWHEVTEQLSADEQFERIKARVRPAV